MFQDRAKLAGAIAIAYVVFFLEAVVVRFFTAGPASTMKYSLLLSIVLLAAACGLAIGIGLWRHYRWAWWLGLVASLFQVFRTGRWLLAHPWVITRPSLSVLIAFVLLVAFVAVLVLPGTRKLCVR